MQRDLTAIRAAMLHAHDVLHSARAMLPESDLGHAEIGEAMRGLREAAALASAPAADHVADDQIEDAAVAAFTASQGPAPMADKLSRIDAILRRLLGAASEPAAEPAAWLHEDDPTRVISAAQKAQAERDGGASASSVRPYSIALPRPAASHPQAQVVATHPAMEVAARWVEARRDAYVNEHGNYDPDTGGTDFPGDGAEYVQELEEIAEGLRALAPLPEPRVDDLAHTVRRLAHSLRQAAPSNDLPGKALDYLKRHGLQGSPLRAAQEQGEQRPEPLPSLARWSQHG